MFGNHKRHILEKKEGYIVRYVANGAEEIINIHAITTNIAGYYKVSFKLEVERIPDPLEKNPFTEEATA